MQLVVKHYTRLIDCCFLNIQRQIFLNSIYMYQEVKELHTLTKHLGSPSVVLWWVCVAHLFSFLCVYVCSYCLCLSPNVACDYGLSLRFSPTFINKYLYKSRMNVTNWEVTVTCHQKGAEVCMDGNKGNNKITELRTILQREIQNS